jgi:hypothetical protein
LNLWIPACNSLDERCGLILLDWEIILANKTSFKFDALEAGWKDDGAYHTV